MEVSDRRSRGAVFTPEVIGRKLAQAALSGRRRPETACDPASGDGRLLAHIRSLAGGETRLFAADIFHPSWLDEETSIIDDCDFYHGNSLLVGLDAWPNAPLGGFDLVIGNPPFRNQLEERTWLEPPEREALKERFGEVASLYADTASMFLVHATQLCAPNGRVAMIMPLSFLTVRDARPARERVLELADLAGIWVANALVFPNATVQVCAVILDRKDTMVPARDHASGGVVDISPVLGGASTERHLQTLPRWSGPNWALETPISIDQKALRYEVTWGKLVADVLNDTPQLDVETNGTLGSLAKATAGFRRQFYGVAPHVFEAGHYPESVESRPTILDGEQAVITSGLIEPGRVLWGQKPTRIAGKKWQAPAIATTAFVDDEPLRRWIEARLVPKVVLATQTSVLEAAIDLEGRWVPSTPVISVHTKEEDLWLVLAVLLSPVASVWAASTFAGAALSTKAIKISASQVEDIPIPFHVAEWNHAASTLRLAYESSILGCNMTGIVKAAELMNKAYAASPQVFQWWYRRVSLKLNG